MILYSEKQTIEKSDIINIYEDQYHNDIQFLIG